MSPITQSNKHPFFIQMSNRGITLIEIMLIAMILVIFSALFFRIYLSMTKQPTLDKTPQEILTIENAMKFYKLDNGFYPTSSQGIAALVIKPTTKPIPQHWTPYLKSIPLDQFGKPYHYTNPGKHAEIDIYSDGH